MSAALAFVAGILVGVLATTAVLVLLVSHGRREKRQEAFRHGQ